MHKLVANGCKYSHLGLQGETWPRNNSVSAALGFLVQEVMASVASGKVRLDIRNNFFYERVVMHWYSHALCGQQHGVHTMPAVPSAARCVTSRSDGQICGEKNPLKKSKRKESRFVLKIMCAASWKVHQKGTTACSTTIVHFPKCWEDAHADPSSLGCSKDISQPLSPSTLPYTSCAPLSYSMSCPPRNSSG